MCFGLPPTDLLKEANTKPQVTPSSSTPPPSSAYVSICKHTPSVSICQHASAYVSRYKVNRLGTGIESTGYASLINRTPPCGGADAVAAAAAAAAGAAPKPAPAYVTIRHHTSPYVTIRHRTSPYVTIRHHTSANSGLQLCRLRAEDSVAVIT